MNTYIVLKHSFGGIFWGRKGGSRLNGLPWKSGEAMCKDGHLKSNVVASLSDAKDMSITIFLLRRRTSLTRSSGFVDYMDQTYEDNTLKR